MNESIEELHKAVVNLFETVCIDTLNLDSLVFLWNNDLQLWTGDWWWMDY